MHNFSPVCCAGRNLSWYWVLCCSPLGADQSFQCGFACGCGATCSSAFGTCGTFLQHIRRHTTQQRDVLPHCKPACLKQNVLVLMRQHVGEIQLFAKLGALVLNLLAQQLVIDDRQGGWTSFRSRTDGNIQHDLHDTHQVTLVQQQAECIALACLYLPASLKLIILVMAAARANLSQAICQVTKSTGRPHFDLSPFAFSAIASASTSGSNTWTKVSLDGGKNLTHDQHAHTQNCRHTIKTLTSSSRSRQTSYS